MEAEEPPKRETMLLHCLLAVVCLPLVILQTYYMNFIFNNNRYIKMDGNQSHGQGQGHGQGNGSYLPSIEQGTIEVEGGGSHAHSHGRPFPPIDSGTIEVESSWSHAHSDSHEVIHPPESGNTDTVEVIPWPWPPYTKPTTTTTKRPNTKTSTKKPHTTKRPTKPTTPTTPSGSQEITFPPNTTTPSPSNGGVGGGNTTAPGGGGGGNTTTPSGGGAGNTTTEGSGGNPETTEPPITTITTTPAGGGGGGGSNETTTPGSGNGNETTTPGNGTGNGNETTPVVPTTELDKEWSPITPHPPNFFDYPEAKCREDMDLHEVFGIALERDRGLPVKVLCNFSNSWGDNWLLMNRMELPARLHMRHWFFGYITEDYKDININYLALSHLMNHMRVAMLIIGQDNNDQLVYNLYDDVVISGFNDLFMLRKANLIEANTTDLLFISIGDVMESYSGRNRSCPFQLLGAWWGHHLWGGAYETFCVFPVERNVQHPGYMAMFIKPSPFAVNNTALYDYAMTTRRPWVPTVNPKLLQEAGNNKTKYDELVFREFLHNKNEVQDEIMKRTALYRDIEAKRKT